MEDQETLSIMRAIGSSIDKLRELNNMAQKHVYEPIHMSPNTYTAIKKGAISRSLYTCDPSFTS